MPKPPPPLKTRLRADERGVTAVEFALIAPVFILLLIGTVELGLLYTGQQMLENATFSATRTSKTGYAAAGKTQAETVAASITKAIGGYLDPAKLTVTSTAYPDYSSMKPEPFTDTNKNGVRDLSEDYVDVNENGKYDDGTGASGLGTGGEIVVFTASYAWRLHTPMMSSLLGSDGVVTLTSTGIAKNEPYASAAGAP